MIRKAEKRSLLYGIIVLCSVFFLLALYSPDQPFTQSQMVQGWETNVSRNTRHFVLPENATTVINLNNPCAPNLFLVVIVCSAPTNFELRSAIRDTWASLAEDSVRVAFLLGEPDNSTVQIRVLEESGNYSDIIQEGFVDSYNNLTIKSVMMLKWVQLFCSSSQFLMKSDDDIYVNLPVLIKALRHVAKRKEILIGFLIFDARPILNSSDKWYTPQHIFNERYYPNYLSGSGYVMSKDVIPKLYNAALKTPIIHLEDVYITGICARIAGVKPMNNDGFLYRRRRISDSCSPSVFTHHRLSPEDLRTAFSNCTSDAVPHTTLPPFIHFLSICPLLVIVTNSVLNHDIYL